MIGMKAINDVIEVIFKMGEGEAEIQALKAIKEAMSIIPDVACNVSNAEADKLAEVYGYLMFAKGILEKMNGN